VSATIYWEPVVPTTNEHLSTPAPQWFMEVLEETNMELPHVFDSDDIPRLRAMAAASGKANRQPFDQLIEALEKHERVRVWPEY
jgi:hypothetical protein